MRLSKPIEYERVTQALAKGGCPVCVVLKDFQSAFLQNVEPEQVEALCNFHAWALAAAANAEHAASILLRLVDDLPTPGKPARHGCNVCAAIRLQEEKSLNELVEELKNRMVVNWIETHGTFCRSHAQKIATRLPMRMQKLLKEITTKNAGELEQALKEYLERVKTGQHAGGGILGRAAEFLVCQRGLPSEDKSNS